MKIYIMTDLEGAAGVGCKADWVIPEGKFYGEAKLLLTGEVNAAVKALFDAGAAEVHVADGHGCGGIVPELLDGRAVLYNRWEPPYFPFRLDGTFDAVLFIGQHAKAGTKHAHLPHTGSHHVLDERVNGRSLGEFGRFALIAYYLGVPVIFGSGDRAFTQEAKDVVPNMVTVPVKEGKNEDSGEAYCFETYDGLFGECDSLPPEEARQAIYEGVRQAMLLLRECGKGYFAARALPAPPYHLVQELRSVRGNPGRALYAYHESDPVALYNAPKREIYQFTHKGMQRRLKKPVWCSLGDSITFQNKWQPLVAKVLELEHVNCGIGCTTVAIPARAGMRPAYCTDERLGLGRFADAKRLTTLDGVPYAPVLPYAPDVVTIFGGANDTLYTKALGDAGELVKPLAEKDKTVFYGAYSYVVETLRAFRPQAKLVLFTLYPFTPAHQIPAVIPQADCNRAIRDIAAYYGLPLIDLAEKFAHWKEEYLPFLPDGVHPSEAGARGIAEVVTEALCQVLG